MQTQQSVNKSDRAWRALAAVVGVLCVAGVVHLQSGGELATGRMMAVSKDVQQDSLGLKTIKMAMTYAEAKSAIEAHGCDALQSGSAWLFPNIYSCQVTSSYVSILISNGATRLLDFKIEKHGDKKSTMKINSHNLISKAPHDTSSTIYMYPWRLVYNNPLPTVRPFPSDYFKASDATNPMAYENGVCPRVVIVAPNGNSVTFGNMVQCKFMGHLPSILTSTRLANGDLVELLLMGYGYNGALSACRIMKFTIGGGNAAIHDFNPTLDMSLVGLPDLGIITCATASFRIVY